jgi:hypothetical protein
MNKIIWLGAVVGLVILPACGGSGQEEQTTPTCVGLPTDSCILTVSESGFVRGAGVVTDGVSTGMIRQTPGRFCMSGTLDPGASNMNWGSLLVLPLTERTPTGIAAPFTAGARGIAQVQFTIDPAPIVGLTVSFTAVQRADCLTIPDCFTSAAFFLMDSGTTETVIDASGIVTASLDSFRQPNWGDPALSFDTNLISSLQLLPQMLPGVVLDYDFCVQDVKFLDAAGSEVSP